MNAAADNLLDQLLAEILTRPGSLAELIEASASAETRIAVATALVRQVPLPDSDKPVALRNRVAGQLAQRKLGAARAVLAGKALRELATAPRLASTKPDEELGAIRRVAARFAQGGLPIPGGTVQALVEKRMMRVVNTDTLHEFVSQAAPLVHRIGRTIELVDQVIGAAPCEVLLKYLKFLFEQRDFERSLLGAKDAAVQAEQVEKLSRRLDTSTVPQMRRAHYHDQLQGVITRLRAGGDQRNGQRAAGRAEDFVTFEGGRYILENWSAVGLLFGPVSAKLDPHQPIKPSVHARTDRGPLQFEADAVVLRADGGKVAAKYRCLNQISDKIIRDYFARRSKKKASA